MSATVVVLTKLSVLMLLFAILTRIYDGCSYSTSHDLWALPMGACFTDDDSDRSSYTMQCNSTHRWYLKYATLPCQGSTEKYMKYINPDRRVDEFVCDGIQCNTASYKSYKINYNDTECLNKSISAPYITAMVLDSCIPSTGYGNQYYRIATCDYLTNTLTIKGYNASDPTCSNIEDLVYNKTFTETSCYTKSDRRYYIEIECFQIGKDQYDKELTINLEWKSNGNSCTVSSDDFVSYMNIFTHDWFDGYIPLWTYNISNFKITFSDSYSVISVDYLITAPVQSTVNYIYDTILSDKWKGDLYQDYNDDDSQCGILVDSTTSITSTTNIITSTTMTTIVSSATDPNINSIDRADYCIPTLMFLMFISIFVY